MSKSNSLNIELLRVLDAQGFRHTNNHNYKVEFKDLMKYRIENILLVCSIYDYYTIVEDGHLQEAIFNEFLDLNLYYAPHIVHATTGETALKEMKENQFDLVITSMRIGNTDITTFSEEFKSLYPDIPLVMLNSQSRELSTLIDRGKLDKFDKIFIWTGDRRIFLAAIKLFEDRINAPHDCTDFGVNCIILIEDSPEFYSSYLPLIFTEVMKQSQMLIEEGKNSAERALRQSARPKILLAGTYEEAMNIFNKYRENVLGIITDIKFKKEGKKDEYAGIKLIKEIRKETPFMPVLIQSSSLREPEIIDELECGYINKTSRSLLLELREFMNKNFGFGDFIFKLPNGSEIARAKTLHDMAEKLKYIPEESLIFHGSHNHFSLWFIARTEFEIAYKIRPVSFAQFKDVSIFRQYLIKEITNKLDEDSRGIISVYRRDNLDEENIFQIIGEGSLGGKARGLAFIDKLLKDYISPEFFPGIDISIPKTVVLGTDVFDHFMEFNKLYEVAFEDHPDEKILHNFLHATLPPTVLGDLREFLKISHNPLAIRSSSLLEDAMYQPFAGIYDTVMIPNSSIDLDIRFHNLVQAIKLVYASTYFKNAKNYIEATGNKLSEEKMAVMVQDLVGRKYGHYFYPHFSGVARSFNYYPFGNTKPADGIVNLALGLGKTIVEGGTSLQYSPPYPGVYPQFATTKDYFSKSQIRFWAVDLNSDIIKKEPTEDMHMTELHISEAEIHGTLTKIASTYSAENDVVYEGISRKGPRIINFAPILKSDVFPMNDILKLLMKMSETAMNCPVEIEFAGIIKNNGNKQAFKFLQVRPMVKPEGNVEIDFNMIPQGDILLKTEMALGNGIYRLKKILFVKPESFNISQTRQIASEINNINQNLLKDEKNYLLIGPGRWGSSDQWLGIPVQFSAISAAQVIVEVPMPHTDVDPSQGSHFFQNMTSFRIAYLTVRNGKENHAIDWNWLNNQFVEHETQYVKLVNLQNEIEIRVDGKTGKGVILKQMIPNS